MMISDSMTIILVCIKSYLLLFNEKLHMLYVMSASILFA